MKLFTKEQIESAIDIPLLLVEIEKGLVFQSLGRVQAAPVSFLQFEKQRGDVHIKSAAILDDGLYVIKIASGFYDNPKWGLSSSNGLMLLFSQRTGELQAILLDEGRLTDLRTALTGAIAAKHLAPKVQRIGIIGTGIQAKEQLLCLSYATTCKEVCLWGRNREKALQFAQDPKLASFSISCARDIEELTESCNLIITTTASAKPLLFGSQIQPGTHITAVGADSLGKQELDASIFDKADLIAADSLTQCLQYGDLAHAHPTRQQQAIELGAYIHKPTKRQPHWITVADLTGVAVADLQTAKTLYQILSSEEVSNGSS